jgi:hypothetical protein
MTKRYKILCSDELNTTYTFIKEETSSRTMYTLIGEKGEVLYSAEDNEDDIKFEKKIGKNFAYHEIAELQLFLNLIHNLAPGLSDTYDVYEKVTTV